MPIKVSLRKKKITKHRLSLYLDFYPAIFNIENGKDTRRQFLGIYIFEKPKTPLEREHNANNLRLAESMKVQMENELNKPEIYSEHEREQLRIKEQLQRSFLKYMEELAWKRKGSNHSNWLSALNYLKEFSNGELTFAQVTINLLEEFKQYLLSTNSIRRKSKKLEHNSAVSYFNKVKATLKQAFKDGILTSDINSRVAPIKEKESSPKFLLLEEINNLIATDCENELLKVAAIFSALTGLRFSDIQDLKWSDIKNLDGNSFYLDFTQKKTQALNILPISEQAIKIIGERKDGDGSVFQGLIYSPENNKRIKRWVRSAGIDKNVTFHWFRHSFGTLQLNSGTDIYTVSQMMGHKSLKSTQVYAKLLEQTKREAANRVKLNL